MSPTVSTGSLVLARIMAKDDPELVDLAMTLTRDFQLIAAVHPDHASGPVVPNDLITPAPQIAAREIPDS